MSGFLSWVLGIILKVCVLFAIGIIVKYLIRNGGGTLKDIIETTIIAVRYGCLKLKLKLVSKLRENAKEEETENGSEGTVV